MNRAERKPKQPMHLTRRGRVVRNVAMAGAVTVGAIGADTVAHHAVNGVDAAIHHITAGGWTNDPIPKFPKGTPTESVTVDTVWEGPQEVVGQVEPQILGTDLEQPVEDYIQKQGQAAGHNLEFGQTVRVPLVGQPLDSNHHHQ